MIRPTLSLARAPQRAAGPSLSMVKKALRLFTGPTVSKAARRRNALAWLRAMRLLGDNHLLKGGTPKWGLPGEPSSGGVYAPRRLGGS